MWFSTVLLVICISVTSAQSSDNLCTSVIFGQCKAACVGSEVENTDYGFYACIDKPGTICCAVIVSPTTQLPPTTEEPTTTAAPTPPPPQPTQEQCGIQMKQDSTFQAARILDGTYSQRCDWPWQVSLRGRKGPTKALTPNKDDTFPFCSGVLIHEEYVATTVYCVNLLTAAGGGTDPTKNILAVAGETDTSSTDFVNFQPTERVYKISEVILHPDSYQSDPALLSVYGLVYGSVSNKTANNLALLKLSRPADLSGCIRKVCLPDPANQPLSQTCKIASWGANTVQVQSDLPGKLQEADVNLFSPELLNTLNLFNPGSSPKLEPLTTIAKFTTDSLGACSSDNGGMVVCQDTEDKWVLNGLINRPEISNCVAGADIVVTDINAASKWINDEIAKGATP